MNGPINGTRYLVARLIIRAPKDRVNIIKELYSDYFTDEKSQLERMSDLNTSFMRWVEDYNINKEWIGDFPTVDVYNNYIRYCISNRLDSMDKSLFYRALQHNFNVSI